MLALGMVTFIVARDGLPRAPQPDDWDIYARQGLLALTAIGAALSARWEGAGAAVITFGGAGFMAVAALEQGTAWTVLMAVAFLPPAMLFWPLWQRTRSLRAGGPLAAILALILVIVGMVGYRVYDIYFAPLQPVSPLVQRPSEHVTWIWAGAVAETSFSVKAAVNGEASGVRLAVSSSQDFGDPRLIEPASVSDLTLPPVYAFDVDGLRPDTRYWYAIDVDGDRDEARAGRVRTFPDGAASFTSAFSACASTGSNGAVFDTIRERDPHFFLSTGDFHYNNVDENDPDLYREAYDESLTAPAQAALYRSVPIAYVWDDHDFGPDNSDRTAPGRQAAQAVYRQIVPHYPLPASDGSGAIYQAFSVGRVRFVLTDLRSERSPEDEPDGPAKTMLGEEQKAWLKQELLDANGTYPVIVWVSSQPWIAPANEESDGWGLYATEREEIANFIADNDIRGLMMLSGDAHALAIDDGSHNTYAADGGPGFPVFHAAALDRSPREKGGPYSHGIYPGGGQFGLVTVNDDGGDTIRIVWSGRDYENTEIVSYRFTVDATPARPAAQAPAGLWIRQLHVVSGLRPARVGEAVGPRHVRRRKRVPYLPSDAER